MLKSFGKRIKRICDFLLTKMRHFRYDSVTFDGAVSYQNRLDSNNVSFFLPSSGIFTNYWVRFLGSMLRLPFVRVTY